MRRYLATSDEHLPAECRDSVEQWCREREQGLLPVKPGQVKVPVA